MTTFSIGERVKCDNREGIVLGMHSADGELFKVWFDEFGDWKYMLESELTSIDALRAENARLVVENERLTVGIRAVLANGLDHWASGEWYADDEKSGRMWKGVRQAATCLHTLLQNK